MKLALLEEQDAPINEIVVGINGEVYRYIGVPKEVRVQVGRVVNKLKNRGRAMKLLKGYEYKKETENWL